VADQSIRSIGFIPEPRFLAMVEPVSGMASKGHAGANGKDSAHLLSPKLEHVANDTLIGVLPTNSLILRSPQGAVGAV